MSAWVQLAGLAADLAIGVTIWRSRCRCPREPAARPWTGAVVPPGASASPPGADCSATAPEMPSPVMPSGQPWPASTRIIARTWIRECGCVLLHDGNGRRYQPCTGCRALMEVATQVNGL